MSKISAMSTKCPKQAIRSKMIRSRISAVGTVPSEVALDGDKHPSLFRLIPHFLQHALAKAPESQHVPCTTCRSGFCQSAQFTCTLPEVTASAALLRLREKPTDRTLSSRREDTVSRSSFTFSSGT